MSDGRVEYEVRADTSKLDSDLSQAKQKVVKSADDTAAKQEKAEKKTVEAVKSGEKEKVSAVEKANDKVEKDSEAAQKSVTKTVKTENEKVKKSAKETGTEVSKQSKKAAEESSEAFEKSSGSIAKSIGKAVAAIGGIATAVKLAKSSIEQAGNAEYSFAKVKTLLSSDDTEKYYNQLIELSNETGVAFDELAESMYSALSAGVAQDKALDFVASSVKLSKGGFTDTATAIDVVTTAINAYGLEMDDAAHIQDVLITTQNLGKTTVDELASSMGQIIPTANAVNVSLDQLGAMYATITANGVATAESTTYMNSMLNEFASSTGKAATALSAATEGTELAGKSFSQLCDEGYNVADILKIVNDYATANGKTMVDMFGSAEAAKAAQILVDNSQKCIDNFDTMVGSAGAADTAAATMMDTFNEKWEKLQTNLNNLLIELGSELMPVAEEIMGFIMDNLPQIKELVKQLGTIISDVFKGVLPIVEGVVKVIVDFKDVLGPLAIGLGAAKVAMTLFTAACSVNPIILAIGAVTALAVGIGNLISQANSCTEEVQALSDAQAQMKQSIDDSLTSQEAENNMLLDKASRYEYLRTQANLTAAQEEELKNLAEELQTKLGDNCEVVNSLTNEYNDLTGAVAQYIETQNAKIKLQAYENAATQSYESDLKIKQDREAIQQQIDSMGTGKLWDMKTQTAAAKENASGLPAVVWYIGKMSQLKNSLAELDRLEAANQATRDEYNQLYSDSFKTSTVDLSGMSDSERASYYRNIKQKGNTTNAGASTSGSGGSTPDYSYTPPVATSSSGTRSASTSNTSTPGSVATSSGKTTPSGNSGGNTINIMSFIPTMWDDAATANAKLEAGGIASSLVGNSKSGKLIDGLSSTATAGATTPQELSDATLNDVVKAINTMKTAQEKMQYTLDVTLKTDNYTLARATVKGINAITKSTGKSPLITP